MPRRGRIPIGEKIEALEARIARGRQKVYALERERDAMLNEALDKARADVAALEVHKSIGTPTSDASS